MSFPVRVESYELLPDSGGAGRWRGGLGARRTWRILDLDSRATVCCERTRSPPFGIAGGAAGAPARISVVEPDGAERVLDSKGSFDAPAGSLVVFDVPGSERVRAGGGSGPRAAPRGSGGRLPHPGWRAPRLRRARPRHPPPGRRERRGAKGAARLRSPRHRPVHGMSAAPPVRSAAERREDLAPPDLQPSSAKPCRGGAGGPLCVLVPSADIPVGNARIQEARNESASLRPVGVKDRLSTR